MRETWIGALVWAAGAGLGTIFFGGLWWTVRKGAVSENPALWFFGSLLLRMGVTMTGFYFASGGHWERLLLCLLGFLMARVAITWITRSAERDSVSAPQEARRAN